MNDQLTGFWRCFTKNQHPFTQRSFFLLMISLLLYYFVMASVAYADDNEETIDDSSSLWQELKEGFDYTFRVLGSGSHLKPAESNQNPDNDFLKLKQYSYDFELRPDFNLFYHQLALMAKPRASFTKEKLENDNAPDEIEWIDETWISEYLIRFGISDSLFLSYGRENLQWGPTMLYSPSNPFFLETGRGNSQEELAGKGFARLVYLPNMVWTFSLIENFDEGSYELSTEEFDKIYAFKLDYNGSKGYSSMILSHQEHHGDEGDHLGMFGAWTAFDSTFIYFEGELSKENNTLYPSSINGHPMGGIMAPLKQDDNSYDGTLIIGGSYTFETLTMLSFEYLYNSRGYSDEEAEDYYAIRRNAANAYYTGPFIGLSRQTLGMTASHGLQYLRQNYLFFEISYKVIKDVLGLIFIWNYNMDDHSNRLILTIDYSFSDHTEFYLNSMSCHGDPDTEFSSILEYNLSLGFKYTF